MEIKNTMIIRYVPDFNLLQIAQSGQCFRMNLLKNGAYSVIAFDKYLEIKDLGSGQFEFSCSEDEFRDVWTDYFDLSCVYCAVRSLIPANDVFLQAAVRYGNGMRILRQEIGRASCR